MIGVEASNVLAIECDWRLRKLIRANLEASGLKVREAVSVQHGLQLIREQRPNLILLDIDRLDVDLQQLFDTLCNHLEEEPVSIILLATEPPSRTLIERECIGGFVRKPFAIPTLLQQIQQALTAPLANQ